MNYSILEKAAPADRGLVAIPGSRGDFSYLVEPIADGADRALSSLARGAGREWSRSDPVHTWR